MNTDNYAKKFIREYEIKKINLNVLEDVITKLGYTLIKYNSLFNNDYVDKLVRGLDLKKELEKKCCFTYKNEYMNYIFIREGMNEKELIPLLLHEIGHIYIKHIDNSLIKNSISLECEAEEFTFKVRSFVNQNYIKRKALYTAPAFLLLALMITVVVLSLKKNESNEFYQKNQESSNVITETTTDPTTEENAESITENDTEKIYYVSKSGKKYHLGDCNYIDVDKCTKLTLEEVKKLGYEPCKVCKPNKQN